MPSAANALKLHDYYTHRRSGGLALAIGLAVVVSFVATTSFMIYLCYDYGASNLRSWFFNASGGAGGRAFDWVAEQTRNPASVDWDKLGLAGSGVVGYLVLAFLHYRIAWWPLHPVGLAVASTWMVQEDCVLSLFGVGMQGVDLALWRRGALPAAQAAVYRAGGGVFLWGFSIVCTRLGLV